MEVFRDICVAPKLRWAFKEGMLVFIVEAMKNTPVNVEARSSQAKSAVNFSPFWFSETWSTAVAMLSADKIKTLMPADKIFVAPRLACLLVLGHKK